MLTYYSLVIWLFCLCRDGQLQESDQILAINGQRVDTVMSHHEAISLLQNTQGIVELIIARGDMPLDELSRQGSTVSSASYNSDVSASQQQVSASVYLLCLF